MLEIYEKDGSKKYTKYCNGPLIWGFWKHFGNIEHEAYC